MDSKCDSLSSVLPFVKEEKFDKSPPSSNSLKNEATEPLKEETTKSTKEEKVKNKTCSSSSKIFRRMSSLTDFQLFPSTDCRSQSMGPLDLRVSEEKEEKEHPERETKKRKTNSSNKEKGKSTKKKKSSEGVTLFPGLIITPGKTTPEEDSAEDQESLEYPDSSSTTPSPSGDAFPRFHFSRSDEKHIGGVKLREDIGANGFENGGGSWWHPALTSPDVTVGSLTDLPLPFHGLPAFCELY